MKKRIMSMLISVTMLFSIFSSPALATEEAAEVFSEDEITGTVDSEVTSDGASDIEEDVISDEKDVFESKEYEEKIVNSDSAYENTKDVKATPEENIESSEAELESDEIELMETVVDSGECEGGIIWTFDSTGTLTISGTGEIDIYEAPWYEYADQITRLVIDDGITYMNSSYDYFGPAVQTLEMGKDLKGITDTINFNFFVHFSDIIIHPQNKYLYFDDYGVLFDKWGTLLRFPVTNSDIGWYPIPYGTTRIHDYAFAGAEYLGDVDFSYNHLLQHIGQGAFMGCNLSILYFPYSLKSIEWQAFWDCNIDEVRIPNNKLSIAMDSFSSVNYVYFAGTEELWNELYRTEYEVDGCIYYEDIFSYNTIEFGGSVLVDSGKCGENLTWELDCDGTLIISGSGDMDPYPGWQLTYGTFIKNVVIGDGVMSIADEAFSSCTAMTNITIPDSVTTIGDNAFSDCTSLKSVTIPSGVTDIGYSIFSGCTSLRTLTLNARYICYLGLSDCSSLTDIILGDGVLQIGREAFYGCTSLKNITIPNSVTDILWGAFYNCNALTDVYYGSVKDAWDMIYIDGVNDPLINATKHFIDCLDSGTCGYDMIWILNEDGTLSISGMGDMSDWSSASEVPWYSYRDKIKSVVIGSDITSIGDYAFHEHLSLADVTISNSVASIGSWSFFNCDSLDSITIPDSVTYIGSTAFYGCDGINSVKIPANVSSMGVRVFWDCDSLEKIAVAPDNASYSSDEYGVLYNKDKTELIQYPIGNDRTEFVIPNSVKVIHYGSFGDCKTLKSIIISDGVENISDWAFAYFFSLSSVTIPDTVTKIGGYAFEGCISLSDVYYDSSEDDWNKIAIIPENIYLINVVKHFTYSTDSGRCGNSLTWVLNEDGTLSISGTGDMTNWNSTLDVPWYTLRDKIKTVIIDDGVTSIGNHAFAECYSVTGVTLPNSVIRIGDWSFSNCDSLDSITIPDSVTYIGKEGFSGCDSIKSFTIPKSVTDMGGWILWNCISLEKIAVDKNNTAYSSDEYGVLYNKDKTRLIHYPIGNTRTEFAVPNSVEIIDIYSFNNCDTLESVTLPESVTTIRDCAFNYCDSLTSITIPKSVIRLEYVTFGSCDSLETITVHKDNPNYMSDEYGVLYNKDKTELLQYPTGNTRTKFEIANGVTRIGDWSFANNIYLTELTVPNSVLSVGNYAFYYFSSLKDVYYKGTEELWNKVDISSHENGNVWLTNANIQFVADELSGTCGTSANWVLDNDGTLTISGSGAMTDFASAAATPWNEHKTKINQIIVEEGITRIGSYAFIGLSAVESITLPETLLSIGNSSFNGCKLITEITIPKNVATIGWSAFYGCLALKNLTLYSSLISIGASAFNSCRNLNYVYFNGNTDNWNSISIAANNTYLTNATIEFMIKEYTVTFKSDDSVIDTVVVESGKVIGANMPAEPEKNGYTFVGWFDGDTQIAADTVVKGDITATAKYDEIVIPDYVTGIEITDAYGNEIDVVTIPYGTKDDEIANIIEEIINVNEIVSDGSKNTNVAYDSIDITNRVTNVEIRAGEFSKTLKIIYETQSAYIDISDDKISVSYSIHSGATNEEIAEFIKNNAKITLYDKYGVAVDNAQYTVVFDSENSKAAVVCEGYETIEINVVLLTLDAYPVIKVSDVIAEPGNEVSVTVSIDGNPGIAALGFNVDYDSQVFFLKDVKLDGIFDESEMIFGDISKNPYIISGVSFVKNTFANGGFITLTFDINENCAEEDYEINVTVPEAYTIDEKTVEFETVGGKIGVRIFEYGDVNSDCKVNRLDYLRLGKYFGGWDVEINERTSDVTADGVINRLDLLRIGKFVTGWNVSLGK